MKVFFLFPILTSLFSASLVYADYRVFVLKITKPSADPAQPPSERIVQSNLDPDQYREYYTVLSDEKISYIDTWRCTGRTGEFQDYCPKPAKETPRQPAAQPAASAENNSAPQKAQIPDTSVSKQNSP